MSLISKNLSRRCLQVCIVIGGCVPVCAGFLGVMGFFTNANDLPLGNHFNYLSGILFAMGLSFWSMVPRIEQHAARFRLLTFLVFIGGLSRLIHSVFYEFYGGGTAFALSMELLVTPLLCIWQKRISDIYR